MADEKSPKTLAEQLEEAAKQMVVKTPPVNLTAQKNADTEEENEKDTASDSFSLAKRRLEAQRAMEGLTRKKKREEDETTKIEADTQKERERKTVAATEKRAAIIEEREREKQKQELESKTIEREGKTARFEEIIREEGGIRPIRTLKEDISKIVSQKKLSIATVATLESQRKNKVDETKIESGPAGHKALAITVILILLILATGILYFIFSAKEINIKDILVRLNRKEPAPIAAPKDLGGLIFAEKIQPIDTTDNSPRATKNLLTAHIKNTNSPFGTIEQIELVKNGEQLKTLNEFLDSIDLQMPETLKRVLSQDKFMFGVHSSIKNSGFIILKTALFEKTYAEMLEWEKRDMVDVLSPALTEISETVGLESKSFKDLIIKNIDTRVLENKNGEPVIIYSMVDSETLVITSTSGAFNEVVRRLNTPKPGELKN